MSDQMNQLEQKYRNMYRNDVFGIIADGGMLSEIGFVNMTRIVTLLNSLKPKTKAQVLASAIIITNPNLRSIISGLMTMYTPVSPMRIVETMEEAQSFVKQNIVNWERMTDGDDYNSPLN